MARVWCTVSTSELSDADPSDVRSSVGPNTMPGKSGKRDIVKTEIEKKRRIKKKVFKQVRFFYSIIFIYLFIIIIVVFFRSRLLCSEDLHLHSTAQMGGGER